VLKVPTGTKNPFLVWELEDMKTGRSIDPVEVGVYISLSTFQIHIRIHIQDIKSK